MQIPTSQSQGGEKKSVREGMQYEEQLEKCSKTTIGQII